MPKPRIVFLHGAFSHGGHFEAWAERFAAAGHHCTVPTLPGHGRDDLDVGSLTIEDFREALAAACFEQADKPVLVGHSMGGLLAQLLACEYPVAALVLIASVPPWALRAPLRSAPFLAPMLPAVLAARKLTATETMLRKLVLNGLADEEIATLVPTFVPESGHAYRAMMLGRAPPA
jgi:pimeloyl-ACP methyl ester carboxylesterase